MGAILHYVTLAGVVIGINVIPAFMPPTWIVLTFYYLHYKMFLPFVVIVGAICATSGRIMLAWLSNRYLRRFIPARPKENLTALADHLLKDKKLTIPVVLTYAFLPISSNQMFIAAGVANADIKIIAISFFVGRMISYTFWISVAHQVADRLDNVFNRHYSNTKAILIELASFLLLYLVSLIDWKKVFKDRSKPVSGKLNVSDSDSRQRKA